jgi:hypothetical protein
LREEAVWLKHSSRKRPYVYGAKIGVWVASENGNEYLLQQQCDSQGDIFGSLERKKIKVNILGAVPLRHVEVLYRRSRILNGTAQQ